MLIKKQITCSKTGEKAIYNHCREKQETKKPKKKSWDNLYQIDACPVKPYARWMESIRNSLFEKAKINRPFKMPFSRFEKKKKKNRIGCVQNQNWLSTIYVRVKGLCSRNLFPSAQVGHCQRKFILFYVSREYVRARALRCARQKTYILSIQTSLPVVI